MWFLDYFFFIFSLFFFIVMSDDGKGKEKVFFYEVVCFLEVGGVIVYKVNGGNEYLLGCLRYVILFNF